MQEQGAENDGAAEPRFTQRVLSRAADGALAVTVADVDGDGDADVLSASFLDDSIAWYRTTQRTFQVVEAQTLVVTESASDIDGNLLTYGIRGGPDAAHFGVDATTGELTFVDAPPVAAPADFNGDNIYEVWVSASDGFSTLNRSIAVEVVAP